MTKTNDQKPKTDEVSAIVLAAGRSERMGAFKPLLPFGQSTVIETGIKNLRDGGVENIIVVLSQSRGEEIKDNLKRAGVSFVFNPESGSQMSDSIAWGVRALPEGTKAVIINPVDHAAVPGSVVERLISAWKRGALLVKPTWKERGGHPVLVDLAFRDRLLSLDPECGLKALFDSHPGEVARVPVDSNYIARDMNTWDDYCALHQEIFGVPPATPRTRDRDLELHLGDANKHFA